MTVDIIANGIQAGVGCAYDQKGNQLYFVEYGAGTLKRINLYPPYTDQIIASGFSHPEDVELDLINDLAYVTTRDDPGTTGALWKVDISTGSKTMVTFNLGAPQQLVLDLEVNSVYTVGYDDGRLRHIDLITGAKTPICTSLDHPVGIAIDKDNNSAYITEQAVAGGHLSRVNLTFGTRTIIDVKESDLSTSYTFTAPFFLTWADITQNSLYVAERNPLNKVSRVDLAAVPVRYDIETGLPFNPSSIAVWGTGMINPSEAGLMLYVVTDSKIVKVQHTAFDLTSPVFLGVGHVPYGKIGNDPTDPDKYGYANTDPGYFFHVKRAPFGGTLNFFGNLTNFTTLGAKYYEVWVSKDGEAPEALSLAWNTYKWNHITYEHDLVPVAPERPRAPGLDDTLYSIPVESDGSFHPELWYPPFLFMRWPSGEDGIYTFYVKLYDAGGVEIPGLPAPLNNLVLKVDNTPPTAEMISVWQQGNPNKIEACDIVSTGANNFTFIITAYDAEGHLYSYGLSALTADNESYSVGSESHAHDVTPWYGVVNHTLPISGAWCAKRRCAHTFWLGVWSKTINGYNRIHHRTYHKSITIDLPPC